VTVFRRPWAVAVVHNALTGLIQTLLRSQNLPVECDIPVYPFLIVAGRHTLIDTGFADNGANHWTLMANLNATLA
jgi:hypothetical protein